MKKSIMDINPKDLDLSTLTFPIVDRETMKKRSQECEAEMNRYEEKYGKNWWDYYARDKGYIVNYDRRMKSVNTAIYYGSLVDGSGPNLFKKREKQKERLKELFGGKYIEYGIIKLTEPKDPEVAEALLRDAQKTGKWKELPDELQTIYHEKYGE